ncbi:MAG: hypothetical protein ACR2HG_10870 [Pyrinomonadaceae bacterium]
MSNKFFRFNFLLVVIFTISLISGCAVESAKSKVENEKNQLPTSVVVAETKNQPAPTTIKIAPDSPADTVRVFYKNLREKRFREALFLTNLRPAIAGLTDTELKDLQVDFEPLAAQVPLEIEINGEIISKDNATVTAKLPDNETDELKIQTINLRKEKGAWTILTVDEKAEGEVKKEGSNYFFALRIKTHHEEAKAMLERVNKAEMIYAMQNGGLYADAQALIGKGFLPKDILSADSTGYNYQIQLSADKKKYAATATPAVYGKTGKLSFGFESDSKKTSALKSQDTKGQPLKM